MPYADLRICLLKGATVKDYSKALCDISCRIWDYAELKFNEKNSAEELAGLLEQEGFEVTRGIAGMETAFTAKWGTGKPVIGFLGEYDALSGLSQEAGVTEKKVRPGTGNGHGCGHNLLGSAASGAADQVEEIGGVKLLTMKLDGVQMNELRTLGDNMKAKTDDGVVVIASTADGKVNLIVMAGDAAQKKGAHAGNMIRAIAGLVGGGGGGRPNMAQAGGKNPAGIDAALKKAAEVLAEQVRA